MTSGSRARAARAYTGLATAQAVGLVAGLITGPILARSLGADGRGLLAALQAPLGFAPYIASLGLGAFAVREAARGVSPAKLVGSLGMPLLVVGGLVAAASPLIAQALAHDKDAVVPYMTVGLALLPIALMLGLAVDVLWGLQKWSVLIALRLMTPLSLVLPIVILALLDELTFKAAAVVVLCSGGATILIGGVWLIRFGRPRFDSDLLREGLAFGLRTWPGTLASVANLRLDQLLMIPFLPARQLGLYAVAVTVSGVGGIAASQVVTVVLPRIADSGEHLVSQAVRLALLVAFLGQVIVGLATLILLVPLFGSDFESARDLVWILALGGIFTPAAGLLGQSLAVAGHPVAPSIGEFGALAVTVPGLILLLDPLQATGAAIVSVAAYGVNFVIQIAFASRHIEAGLRNYVPGRAEVRILARSLREVVRSRKNPEEQTDRPGTS